MRFLASLEMTTAMRRMKKRLAGGFAANQPPFYPVHRRRHFERSEKPNPKTKFSL
jgi:hypothetical protein